MAFQEAAVAGGPRFPRRIAHCDLDTFFVAVERVYDPSLVGRPVLVGHPGARGVVASASYEARRFGCHSAQPMVQALQLCPQAVVVPPSFDRYGPVSRAFHQMLRAVAPLVESAGIDEAYADLTGVEPDAGGAAAVARRLRGRVRAELGIAVSVCIAGSRTTVKVGSDRAKPDGLLEVPAGTDAAFLAPIAIRELPLVGPKLAERLAAVAVRTIGDAASLDADWLEHRFGKAGALLADRARGIDPTPVRASGRGARSISREVTYGADVTDVATLRQTLARHAASVAAELRAAHSRARTVTLKLRWNDFTTISRSRTIDRPLQATTVLTEVGVALLDEAIQAQGMRPVRLIGLGATNLVEDAVQLSFDDGEIVRDERLDHTLDTLRGRFGSDAVSRGVRGRPVRR